MNTNSVNELLIKFNNLNDESIPKWAIVLIDCMKILIEEFKGFSDILSNNVRLEDYKAINENVTAQLHAGNSRLTENIEVLESRWDNNE